MKKVVSADGSNRALLALFDDLTRAGVNVDVYEPDEMFQVFYWGQGCNTDSSLAMYLASGRAIWQTVREVLAWRFGAPEKVGRLLDFAAGFGRVTRFMVQEIPSDRIWVSDLQADALEAQGASFGVHTFHSAEDPAALALPGTFDAVIVSSLFTHLPPSRFTQWLAKLGGAVAPGGLLLLSVHGAELLAQPTDTIEFKPSSESQKLPGESYGSTWVSEAFVRQAVREALGDAWQVVKFERGLVSLQDLYVLLPDGATDPALLRLPRQLDGFVEHFEIDAANRLQISGWFADRQCRQTPVALRLRLGDTLLTDLGADVFTVREGVQVVLRDGSLPAWGYAFEVSLTAGWDPGETLSLTCLFSDGGEVPLLQGTLGWALLRGARVAALYTGYRMQAVEREHAEARERLAEAHRRIAELEDQVRVLTPPASRVPGLEAHIRWMEASRFWRLRNHWFSFKKALRI